MSLRYRRRPAGGLAEAPGAGVVGGRINVAVTAAGAEQAAVTTLLTFKVRHFRPPLPAAIAVVAPPER